MRKRDFEAIAGAVKSARDSLCLSSPDAPSAVNPAFDSMARQLADTLARQSARFNRVRFLHGCGVSEESLKKACNFPGALIV